MKRFPALLIPAACCLLFASVQGGHPQTAFAGQQVSRVPDFVLKTTNGTPFQFYSLAGKKAVVLFFVGADCPIAKLYLPRLQEISQKYAAQGVTVLGVNSNANETPEQMATAAKAAGVTFPILMDPTQQLADTLKVTRTCDAVVVDGQAQLRYKGAVDNQYGFTGRKAAPTETYLLDALSATLSGKPAPKVAAEASGCLLDRLTPVAAKSAAANEPEAGDAPPQYGADAPLPPVGKVTWAKDVAPILQAKCESCHRPGQVAPFALQTYAQARRWASMINETVTTKRMPPWQADTRHGNFANDRSLTPAQKATLLAWVKQGVPQGDLKKAPAPAKFTDGWNIAKPDVVLAMDKPYTVKATGQLEYQWFRVPTNFTEDKWIQAAEVKPGDRTVIHHVLVFVDDHTSPKPTNGLDGFVAEYVPGESPMILPEGVAKRIPAGADLLFQIHYTPTGTEKVDKTSLGFVFAKKAPESIADTVGLLKQMTIPPGADNVRVARSFTVPTDMTVYAFSPHMHMRGKAFRIAATYPDGTQETLLSVPHYDFNWQTRYELKQPKQMLKGTKIQVDGWFDNSTKNPYNPDPTKTVHWGDQTTDEMMIGYLDYIVEGNQTKTVRQQNMLQLLQDMRPKTK